MSVTNESENRPGLLPPGAKRRSVINEIVERQTSAVDSSNKSPK